MNIRTSIAALGVAFSFACAGAASAATIQLNVNKGWTQGSHTYSNGAESVSVEAFNYNDSLPPSLMGNPWLASWSGNNGGLGICSGKVKNGVCKYDQHTVDGFGDNEMAVLNFGSLMVKLTSITFSYVDKKDKFEVFAFGNGVNAVATAYQLGLNLPNNCSVCTVSNFDLAAGSIFGIGAFNNHANFKIKAIHFDVIEPGVVPLPAAGWMLLAGLGGLAAIRRRRKAA